MVTQGAYGPPGSELQRLYDADAVDRYVGQLHAHIEDLQRQVGEALRIARDAEERVAAASNAEAALGRALLTAQRSADGMIVDAERRAQLILADARLEADRLLGDVRADAQQIVDEAHETVETVFAALTSAREQQLAAPALPPVPPPPPEELGPDTFGTSGYGASAFGSPGFGSPAVGSSGSASETFAPPPPMPAWPAPDPAQRQIIEDEPGEAASASAAPEDPDEGDEPEGEGLIVDLRPMRSAHSGAPAMHAGPGGNGDGGWTASLGGTGTEGIPSLDREPAWVPTPDPVPTRPGGELQADAGPTRPGGELLDRWRLARGGPAAVDDAFVSRRAEMDSLADGSWVAHLRGDATAAFGRDPASEPWHPKSPPSGPPVEPPGRRFGPFGRRHH